MSDILARIADYKRAEVAERKGRIGLSDLEDRRQRPPPRLVVFKAALDRGSAGGKARP